MVLGHSMEGESSALADGGSSMVVLTVTDFVWCLGFLLGWQSISFLGWA